MAYASVAELRQHLGYQTSQVGDDALLTAALAATSEAVDAYCGRSFTVPVEDPPDVVRIFDGGSEQVYIDDLLTVTTVEGSYDMSTWTTADASDWWLLPHNTYPKTAIFFASVGPRRVRVTGVFGWSDVPASVKQATLVKAAALFKRKDSPSGVEGFGEFGVVRISRYEDADVVRLLSAYVRADQIVGVA